MDNILAEVSEVAGTNMAALGVGGFGLLTSPTSALGRVTPHRRLVRRLALGPGCHKAKCRILYRQRPAQWGMRRDAVTTASIRVAVVIFAGVL